MIPFPDLDISVRGKIATIKLTNEQLVKMLKRALSGQNFNVTNIEIYPDVFVVEASLKDIENKIKQRGLDAEIDPKTIKIIIKRESLIEGFIKATKFPEKGLKVEDKKDYIIIEGEITGIPKQLW